MWSQTLLPFQLPIPLRTSGRNLPLITLLMALLLIVAAPGTAQDYPAQLRVANYSPDSPVLEIWIDGVKSDIQTIKWNDISGWVQITAGSHQIAFVPQGDTLENALIGPITVNLPSGSWSTIPVLGLTNARNVYAVLISENYPTPIPAGMSRITVFNGIPGGPPLDLINVNDGSVLASRINFGRSANVDLPAGGHALRIAPTGNPNSGLSTGQIQLNEATYYLLGAIRRESGGGLVLRAITQEQVSGLLAGQPESTFPTATPPAPTPVPRTPVQQPQATQVAGQVTANPVTPVPQPQATVPVPTRDPNRPASLIEIISTEPQLAAMTRIVNSFGLADVLQTAGPYTIFAPTDRALQTLITENPAALPDNAALRRLMAYLIVRDRIREQDLFDQMSLLSLSGQFFRITRQNDRWIINNVAPIIQTNLIATNGIVHIIDGVPLPPSNSTPTAPIAQG